MKLQKFIQSDYGKMVISIILGFGLSTLFRKTCSDKECLKFVGPALKHLKGQVYTYDDKCYKFNSKSVDCSSTKRTVRFT